MIVGKERVRGFMIAMVILVVLLVFLLLLTWFHNRKGHPHQPEPPLHARYYPMTEWAKRIWRSSSLTNNSGAFRKGNSEKSTEHTY